MSHNKKYYYIKVKDSYFERDNVRILESQDNGYIYSLIILKLCLKSAKYEGCLMMTDRIPYTPEKVDILAKIINHDVAHVKEAIKMASELDIISIVGSEEIWMTDIQDMIGSSSTEGDRKKKYRNKLANKENGTFVHQLSGTSDQVGHLSTRDRERVKSLELKKEKDIEIKKENHPIYENINYQEPKETLESLFTKSVNYWNNNIALEGWVRCRYTGTMTIPTNKAIEIKKKFDLFTIYEIKEAIDNLVTCWNRINPQFRLSTYDGLMGKIESWTNEANPCERYPKVEIKRDYRTAEERRYFTQVLPMNADDKDWIEGKKQECIDSLNAIGEEFIDYAEC